VVLAVSRGGRVIYCKMVEVSSLEALNFAKKIGDFHSLTIKRQYDSRLFANSKPAYIHHVTMVVLYRNDDP